MSTYTYTTLDDPSATSTYAYGINASGQIVGFYTQVSSNRATSTHGFFDDAGNYTTLDDPQGTFGNFAGGINDSGQIVGSYQILGPDSAVATHGYLYSGGTYTTLDDPSATGTITRTTYASDINNDGQIVGFFSGPDGSSHGFLYSGGGWTTLDDPSANFGTRATGINDSGQIVGYYSAGNLITGGGAHGFLYSGGSYTTLDDPLATRGTFATGINNAGEVVGYYFVAGEPAHGFLYSDGIYTTLDDPLATNGNTYATGINDAGQIVGFYSDATGAFHGFEATPTPFGPPQLFLLNFAPSAGGWSSQDQYPRELGDVNGDGLADIVGFGVDGTWVSLAAGSGNFAAPFLALSNFGTAAGGWSSQDQYPRQFGDVNGDGLADIVGFGVDGAWVSLAAGSGNFAAPLLALSNFGTAAGGWSSQDQYPRQLGDVNGDGLADVVGFGVDGVWVSLAAGSGNFAAPFLALSNFSTAAGGWSSQDQYPRQLGDVNGDGLADIVGFGVDGVWVSLAAGSGNFAAPLLALSNFGTAAGGWSSQDQYPRQLGDVDGDGLADIVGFGSGGGWVADGRSDGTFDQPLFDFSCFGYSSSAGDWTSNNLYPRVLGDTTGDHKADVIGFGAAGVWESLSTDLVSPTSPFATSLTKFGV